MGETMLKDVKRKIKRKRKHEYRRNYKWIKRSREQKDKDGEICENR